MPSLGEFAAMWGFLLLTMFLPIRLKRALFNSKTPDRQENRMSKQSYTPGPWEQRNNRVFSGGKCICSNVNAASPTHRT